MRGWPYIRGKGQPCISRFIAWMRRRRGIERIGRDPFHGRSPVARTRANRRSSRQRNVAERHRSSSRRTKAATASRRRSRGRATLAVAEEFYRQEEWEKAGKLFGKVADDKANPPLQAERARFYEGECLRMRHLYPDAMSTYNRLLMEFQRGVFREKAVARMYEIANYWLDDTRAQLDAEMQKAEGKRWFVPGNFFHLTDKSKPSLDEEGHALKMLEQVYYNDPTGPYAEKALFAAGYVYFRRGNFQRSQ